MLKFVKKILQKSQVPSPKRRVSLPDSAYITLNFQSDNPHKFFLYGEKMVAFLIWPGQYFFYPET